MGFRADLRSLAGSAARAGAAQVNRWAEERTTNDRMSNFDDTLEKAADRAKASGKDGTHNLQPGPDGQPARDPKAIHFNPFDLVAAMGYRERPTALTFAAMEMIGRGVPVVADVVGTRIKQVTMFCEIPETRYHPGFRVRPRDWRTKRTTKATQKRADELTQLMLHTGHYDPERPWESVSLRDFTAQFIGDSLIFDQATFEIVPNRKGKPAYITIVDPSTVRLIDPGVRSPGDPFAVQIVNGSIMESFLPEELAFCVRVTHKPSSLRVRNAARVVTRKLLEGLAALHVRRHVRPRAASAH